MDHGDGHVRIMSNTRRVLNPTSSATPTLSKTQDCNVAMGLDREIQPKERGLKLDIGCIQKIRPICFL